METKDRQGEMFGFCDTKQEYWGPVSKDFTDAYLELLYENLKCNLRQQRKDHKKVFSAVSELLHNIVNYNIKNFNNDFPPSYIGIELLENTAVLQFHNIVLTNSVDGLAKSFGKLTETKKEDVDTLCRNSILGNQSLGLLLLNRNKDTGFHWEFSKEEEQDWLKILITVNYGSISN